MDTRITDADTGEVLRVKAITLSADADEGLWRAMLAMYRMTTDGKIDLIDGHPVFDQEEAIVVGFGAQC